jgi:hypothetical protein
MICLLYLGGGIASSNSFLEYRIFLSSHNHWVTEPWRRGLVVLSPPAELPMGRGIESRKGTGW